MPIIPIVGPTYQDDSLNFDAQRSVNVFPVASESGTSKSQAYLALCPGYELFSAASNEEARGEHFAAGRAFFVLSNTLYEIFSDGSRIARGTLNTTTGYVGMSDNNTQIVMVDGPNGYILRLSDNDFQEITAAGWRGSNTVAYLDGYFVFAEPETDIYYISAINDGSVIDLLDFAAAEGAPDNIVAIITLHQQVWLLGENTIQILYNSGDAGFPLSNLSNVFIEYGCAAVASVCKNANTIFWLGQDKDGDGVVWMANGYQPQRISTFAIEQKIATSNDISMASSYTYNENGQYFYALSVPGLPTTFVYDIGQGIWHERAFFNTVTGQYERHRAKGHLFAFGKHLISDYQTGDIYYQSTRLYSFAGQPIRWSRALAHMFSKDMSYLFINKLQVDMQTGVGAESGAAENINPEIFLDFSDDGGHTWSNQKTAFVGKIGNYLARVIWRRLGKTRDRVFRIVGSTATRVAIMRAFVSMENAVDVEQ